MAFTESNMIELGVKAPDFILPDTISGSMVSYHDIKGKNGSVILFLCNHCPYVIHVNEELVRIANEYKLKDIGFVAISSNDAANYPDDGPDKMSLVAKMLKYPFPYLYDESQNIARSYEAACTPDIYLFDGDDKLYYRGRLDESRPGNDKPLNGKDLRLALDLLLRGEPPMISQYPSAGCNIKWKK
ncbi:MAG: thioredoxin family protein [Saprospiraceae bacterium]|jgi:peroxiredoxin|nr:thioredoxin family protein [Saprospiraceae bacterium]MBL0023615.1 thioredoxin family protein [Saprospiraceae bacterium]